MASSSSFSAFTSASVGGHAVASLGGARAAVNAPREGAVACLRRVLANKTTLPESYVKVIQAFLQQIDHLQKPMAKYESRFQYEYREICKSIFDAPWYDDAITPQTKHTLAKNRYRDVLPFEKTRVKLANAHNRVAGDYINANFIDDAYIACCAPVPNAIADFWHMVWESDVFVVLMLTNFVERERIKADLYWDTRGRAIEFDGVFVQLVGGEENQATPGGNFIVRKFRVWTATTKASPRVLLHVQLTTWPDHGVLRDFRVIAPMLELVNSYRDDASLALPAGRFARVIVHCSAGIGRSGTFIAIDLILKMLQEAFAAASALDGETLLRQALDVRSIVHRLRIQRPGMVQTPEQYEMIYRYVAAVLTNQQPW